jgi:hypothetical protein
LNNRNSLRNEAKEILLGNWMNGFTIPTKKLYPFQWNWDSGFTSLGICHFNLAYSIQELESLFSGQWENGMVPHIIFHSENEKTYFPNHDFWNADVNSGAPIQPKTSGITQPPVHGFILEAMLDKYPDDEKLIQAAKKLYPKILKSHRFFYTYRDPHREGLAFIFHPWESGRDNSPLWDTSMDRIEINKSELPEYKRQDTSLASSDERPTTEQYDRYVYLLELGKKHKYDGLGISEESPFMIQDTLINTVLIKSNQSLINIGKRFGWDTGELDEWNQQSISKFREKLWDDKIQSYACYDMVDNSTISHREIGGVSAIFGNIPTKEQGDMINSYIKSLHQRDYFVCPSFDVDSPLFDSKRYWRGPIWPQMNWMIHKGLKYYGYDDTADIVKNDLIALVEELGFYEYFESQKSVAATLKTGYGGGDFSWTAACILDLIES